MRLQHYIAAGLLVILMGLGWYVTALRADNAALRAAMAAAEREVAARDRIIAQKAEAAAVLAARLQREASDAGRYRALRETLEGRGDEPLPDWFRAYLNDLLREAR